MKSASVSPLALQPKNGGARHNGHAAQAKAGFDTALHAKGAPAHGAPVATKKTAAGAAAEDTERQPPHAYGLALALSRKAAALETATQAPAIDEPSEHDAGTPASERTARRTARRDDEAANDDAVHQEAASIVPPTAIPDRKLGLTWKLSAFEAFGQPEPAEDAGTADLEQKFAKETKEEVRQPPVVHASAAGPGANVQHAIHTLPIIQDEALLSALQEADTPKPPSDDPGLDDRNAGGNTKTELPADADDTPPAILSVDATVAAAPAPQAPAPTPAPAHESAKPVFQPAADTPKDRRTVNEAKAPIAPVASAAPPLPAPSQIMAQPVADVAGASPTVISPAVSTVRIAMPATVKTIDIDVTHASAGLRVSPAVSAFVAGALHAAKLEEKGADGDAKDTGRGTGGRDRLEARLSANTVEAGAPSLRQTVGMTVAAQGPETPEAPPSKAMSTSFAADAAAAPTSDDASPAEDTKKPAVVDKPASFVPAKSAEALSVAAVPASTAAGLVEAISTSVPGHAAAKAHILPGEAARDVANAQQTLKIQLHPAELGVVTATLRMAGDQLSVEIATNRKEAYERLNADSETIVKSLKALGLQVGQVTVQPPQAAVIGTVQADAGASMQDASRGNQQFPQAGQSAGGDAKGGSGGSHQGDSHHGSQSQGQARPAAESGGSGGLYI